MSKNPINGVDTIVRNGRGFNMTLAAHFRIGASEDKLDARKNFTDHPDENHRCQ